MNIGYGLTGSSPQLSARLQYFRDGHDETIMNRDRLLTRAIELVGEMQEGYIAPRPPFARLANWQLHDKMDKFMKKGVDNGDFMPHDRTVAMTIAKVMLQAEDDPESVDEQALYARERNAFVTLAKTRETHARISSMLDTGMAVRN